ncbi:GNAT family N-acetyltransferase [Lysinibacillus cavernae]|uniref:GNAT family N-acetyltransferase n=1 Tax=Lysinibacillus cavernae TaxID=2666135 RepID=UPI0012D92B24|nr:GNAT family protein [Lysinibacillus cavernae]
MNITTQRLLIRTFEAQDVKAIYSYMSDKNVMHYMPEGVLNEAQVQKFITENSGEQAKHYAIVLRDQQQVIGHMVFHRYFGEHTYEVGWVLNPTYHNHGFASEAAHAVIDYGFTKMKLHRIIATCQPENIASFRVMEKIGMRREGFFKKCIPHRDAWWDEYYYAVLQEEWNKST